MRCIDGDSDTYLRSNRAGYLSKLNSLDRRGDGRRTSISPNIKERRDYSCAVFDAQCRVIAMGDHMPVHLGSMPMSVKVAVESFFLERGDIAILNDPYVGGTHLPDITLVLPVFVEHLSTPVFYVAARAHHADVGGTFAGSMVPAVKFIRKAFAFLRFASSAVARSIVRSFHLFCTTYARRWSGKAILPHR